MSRSRRPQCSCGRGCPVCGDAGEVRRAREEDARRTDERELYDQGPAQDSLAPVDERALYDQQPEQDSRRGGWGGF